MKRHPGENTKNNQNIDGFTQYQNDVRQIVGNWPDWKKEILGLPRGDGPTASVETTVNTKGNEK